MKDLVDANMENKKNKMNHWKVVSTQQQQVS